MWVYTIARDTTASLSRLDVCMNLQARPSTPETAHFGARRKCCQAD